MHSSRPTTRTLLPPWDLHKVLDKLAGPPFEPMHKASLKNLTLKTVFLLAAATARRRSTLHALSVQADHIRWEPHGVRLVPHPSFMAKNQTAEFLPQPMFLADIKYFSSVHEDEVWCPGRAL